MLGTLPDKNTTGVDQVSTAKVDSMVTRDISPETSSSKVVASLSTTIQQTNEGSIPELCSNSSSTAPNLNVEASIQQGPLTIASDERNSGPLSSEQKPVSIIVANVQTNTKEVRVQKEAVTPPSIISLSCVTMTSKHISASQSKLHPNVEYDERLYVDYAYMSCPHAGVESSNEEASNSDSLSDSSTVSLHPATRDVSLPAADSIANRSVEQDESQQISEEDSNYILRPNAEEFIPMTYNPYAIEFVPAAAENGYTMSMYPPSMYMTYIPYPQHYQSGYYHASNQSNQYYPHNTQYQGRKRYTRNGMNSNENGSNYRSLTSNKKYESRRPSRDTTWGPRVGHNSSAVSGNDAHDALQQNLESNSHLSQSEPTESSDSSSIDVGSAPSSSAASITTTAAPSSPPPAPLAFAKAAALGAAKSSPSTSSMVTSIVPRSVPASAPQSITPSSSSSRDSLNGSLPINSHRINKNSNLHSTSETNGRHHGDNASELVTHTLLDFVGKSDIEALKLDKRNFSRAHGGSRKTNGNQSNEYSNANVHRKLSVSPGTNNISSDQNARRRSEPAARSSHHANGDGFNHRRSVTNDVRPKLRLASNGSIGSIGKPVKCIYGEACQNREKGCSFYHANESCRYYPNCKYGNDCLYLHPNNPASHQRPEENHNGIANDQSSAGEHPNDSESGISVTPARPLSPVETLPSKSSALVVA